MQLRWKGIRAVGSQGIPQSHREHNSLQFCSRDRFPQSKCSNSAPAGEGFPSSCYSSAGSAVEKGYSSTQVRRSVTTLVAEGKLSPVKVFRFCSAPEKVVIAELCSGENVTSQRTSLKRFIGKEESRREGASGEKQQTEQGTDLI